ncbi:TonB family protein [Sphingomonas colocasiae]|uniref:TonB family protein n=2 Tax=Sphingomonas colocasiae TaxID=1848973 RepID=A0ABS7PV94_9SPHN|nr:TonB family protein [Sphingomonas colocasiae]
MVGALVFMSPAVREKIPTIFETINIPVEKQPEPTKPEPQKQHRQAATENIIPVKPPIAEPTTGFRVPDIPIPPTGSILGPIADPAPPPPLPHVPVFKGSQVDPRYAGTLQPPYPPGKIRSGEEGVVVVRVLVGPDGRVKDVQKVEAADEVFFRATAEQAMKRWRFTPATSDGTPVESWRTMTVRFKLDT